MENYNYVPKTRAELKTKAKETLRGNWGGAILVSIIYSLILGILSCIPFIGGIGEFIIIGPLSLGIVTYYIKLIRGEDRKIEDIFSGFKNFSTSFVASLLQTLYVLLWTLLLIIPGIIAGYSYSMAFYILKDHPDISANEALHLSKEMMKGEKGRLFVLQLSFIGWQLLATLTLGIGYIWLIPYMLTTTTAFYEDVKTKLEAK